MKDKFSIVKLIVLLALIAGLLITGYAAQAAAQIASSRPAAGASQSAFVSALKVETAIQQSVGALKSDDRSVEVKNEIQPGDDKGGLKQDLENATAEPELNDDHGMDQGTPEAEPTDDRVIQATPEAEPTDDRVISPATPEPQPTDDRNLVEEPNENEPVEDNQGLNENEDNHNVAATPQAGGKIEFSGQLTAINGNVLTVNGVSVVISSATEVKGNPQVGDTVRVEGVLSVNGAIQAREVKLRDNPQGEDQQDGNGPAINPTAQVDNHHDNVGPVDSSNPSQNNSSHDGNGDNGGNHDGNGDHGGNNGSNGDHGGHDGSGHH